MYDIKDLGKHNSVLGMTVEFDENEGSISLHQKNLIVKTLERFGMSDSKPKATPLPVGSLMNMDTQPSPTPSSDIKFMKDKDYRGVLGSLNHIANVLVQTSPLPQIISSDMPLTRIPFTGIELCTYWDT